MKAAFHESMGRIPSPFCRDGLFEKGEAIVIDQTSNLSLVITSLGINLIEKHDFFQCKGCRFRIDPFVAIKIFKLTPDIYNICEAEIGETGAGYMNIKLT